jgi:hypothetical protein
MDTSPGKDSRIPYQAFKTLRWAGRTRSENKGLVYFGEDLLFILILLVISRLADGYLFVRMQLLAAFDLIGGRLL